jgi:hypothetical protein
MPDYSNYRVPRESAMGREVRMEQRRVTNRAALFAIAGVLVLCVCLCLGIVLARIATGPLPLGSLAGAFAGATKTPAETPTPTAVPFGKSAKNNAGLRLIVVTYQRPLPAQGIEIPAGQELALVSVRLDNTRTTGAPIKYAPTDFRLVSPEGDEFSPDVGTITTGSMLSAAEVAPGKSVSGDLVFFVYSDVKDLELAWTSADGTTRLFKLTR